MNGRIQAQSFGRREILFTLTVEDRRSKILIEHISALRTAFRQTRRERPFAIDAIVVLPDHLHVVLTLPDGDADFAGRWRRIKGSFSTRLLRNGLAIKRHASGELALWQRRYWEHTIRDDADFARHVDYIHYNPVKHGLVTRVRDWPYSSFRHYVRRGILPSDWAGDPSESAAGYGERSSSHEP
jgi:putative transposase